MLEVSLSSSSLAVLGSGDNKRGFPQTCPASGMHTEPLQQSACAFRSRSARLRSHKQTGSSAPRLLLLLGQVDPCAPSPGMCSSTPAHSAGRDARGNSSLAAPRLLWDELTLVIIDAKLILYRSQFIIAADFCYTVKTDVHLEHCPASAVSPMRAGSVSALQAPEVAVGLCFSPLKSSRSWSCLQ